MSTTIDDLQIKIQGDSVKASASIDTLVRKLDRLSVSITNIDNAKLGNLAGGVDKLGRAMQIMNTVKTSDFTRLATNLNKLNNVNVANLKSVSKNILNVGNSIKGLEGTTKGAEQISQLAKAMAQLGYKSSTKAIENIPKLAVAMRQLMTELSKAPMVSNNLINMTNALAKLARTGASSGKAATSLSKSLNAFSSASNMATKSSFSLASAIGKVYATYFLLFRAFGKIREAINLSSALTEVQNVVDVTFKDMSYKVEKLAKTSIEQFGLSELSLKQFASRFQAMGSAMKIDPTAISGATKYLNEQTKGYVDLSNSMSDVSLTLTKLTADMASFYNVEQEDVAQDLESIFTGMTRPLRAYGLDLTEATLKEWALRNGINANIDSMSQAQKTMLRYQYVLANTTNAQGDFLRTQDTWANQTRILRQNFEQLGIVIGRTFINMLKPAVSALNQLMSGIIKFAQTVSNALGKIFGWKYEVSGGGVASDMEDASIGAEDISESLGDAVGNAKKLKTLLLGIDELNVLNYDDTASSGGGGSAGGGVSGGSMPTDGWVQTDSIIENFKSELSSLYAVGTYVSSTISDALEKIDWTKVYEKASNFGKGLADFLNGLISPRLFGDLGKTIAGAINTAILAYKEFWTNFDGTNLGKSIANGINNFFKEIKAKELAEGMNAFVDTIEDALSEAIKNLDWKTVFSKIGEFLGSLDADTVLFFLGVRGIKKFGSKIGTAIGNTIKEKILDNIPTEGIAKAICKAIGEKIAQSKSVSFIVVGIKELLASAGITSVATGLAGIAGIITIGVAFAFVGKEFVSDFKNWKKNIDKYGWEEGRKKTASEKTSNPYQNGTVDTKWIDDFNQKINDMNANLEKNLDIMWENVSGWYINNVAPWFTKERWQQLGENIKSGIVSKWQEFVTWWKDTGIYDWWTKNVAPWFTKERWQQLGENIKSGIVSKWQEFVTWWKDTGIYDWWSRNVAPWFTRNKWVSISSGMKSGIEDKWNSLVSWWSSTGFPRWWRDVSNNFSKEKWSFSGIYDGISSAFNNAISSMKKIWDNFADLVNEKLTFSWDAVVVAGIEVVPAGSVKLGSLPKFYKDGGFPQTADLFYANENGVPELVGTMGGRTAVASGTEITGISNAIYDTSKEEIALLRQQNQLLTQLLAKETTVNFGDREIARASIRGQKEMGMQIIY